MHRESDLRKNRGVTMLFISNVLGVVRYMCEAAGVMYLGRIVESAPTGELFEQPRHPYTQALLAQIPSMAAGRRDYQPIVSEIPSPLSPPQGCHFHPRCPKAMDVCRQQAPAETVVAAHRSRCWLNDAETTASAAMVS